MVEINLVCPCCGAYHFDNVDNKLKCPDCEWEGYVEELNIQYFEV